MACCPNCGHVFKASAEAHIDYAGPLLSPYLGPCWIWTARINRGGYGEITIGTQRIRTHRWMYEKVRGPIPDGLQIDHLCRRRACCNPAHLEAVTQRENLLRGAGPAAKHAQKTHCIHGHPFDATNTYWRKNGTRDCRICQAKAQKRAKERQRIAKALHVLSAEKPPKAAETTRSRTSSQPPS